jgi:prolyl 4-hydroxylase
MALHLHHWLRVAALSLLLLLLLPPGASSGRLGSDDGTERLPGWKGEVARTPSKGELLAQEDRARGTWVEVISWRPRAFVIHNFMSPEECVGIIKIAKPFMRRSTVVDSVTGESKVDPIRTRCAVALRPGCNGGL